MKDRRFKNIPILIIIVLFLFAIAFFYCVNNFSETLIRINQILQSKIILNIAFTFTALTFCAHMWLKFNKYESDDEKDVAWTIIDYLTYALTFYTFYQLFYGIYYQLTSGTDAVFINSKEFDMTLFTVFLGIAFFRPFPSLIGKWKQFLEFYSSEDIQVESDH